MQNLTNVLEERDFTSEEKAQFDRLKAATNTARDAFNQAVDQIAQDQRYGGAGSERFMTRSAALRALMLPEAGFSTLHDFMGAVRQNGIAMRRGGQRDQRLMTILAAAPSTAASESAGADGGHLVPPNYADALFSMAAELGEDSLLGMVDQQVLEQGNELTLPQDVTAPWGTDGIQVAWTRELGVIPQSKPVLRAMSLKLSKVAALVPISNELQEDSPYYPTSFLPEQFGTKLAWAIGQSILYGTGVGQPHGALNSPAAVVVEKDTSQVSNTISATNLVNMLSRLPPGSRKRAVWMINPSVEPALLTLTLGNYPMFVPLGAGGAPFADAPGGKLLGRPVIWTQHARRFSSEGDVNLVDLRYYQAITKAGGVQTASSMHLFFDADATAFRVTFRMDGAPKLTAPITTPHGDALSPFVRLGAR